MRSMVLYQLVVLLEILKLHLEILVAASPSAEDPFFRSLHP